jgi:DNA-binding MarR family transcriptional regulator
LASTGYWLKLVALAYQRELDAALRPLELTTTQFSILAGVSWLGQHGSWPTQQELARFAGIDRMMTSKVLQTLTRRRLVHRTVRADDARVRCVELTPRGRDAVKQSTALARDVDLRMFGPDPALGDLLRSRFGHLAG